ncbi:MAG: DegT/DnrJ/EryC1/StrS family aminotransferase [Adhaeribacter sp.]
MEPIRDLAQAHTLYIIEDTVQALGSEYTFLMGACGGPAPSGILAALLFLPKPGRGFIMCDFQRKKLN